MRVETEYGYASLCLVRTYHISFALGFNNRLIKVNIPESLIRQTDSHYVCKYRRTIKCILTSFQLTLSQIYAKR